MNENVDILIYKLLAFCINMLRLLQDDNSPETANGRYVLKEEAKDFYSPTRISENNIREQTASKDVQQQQLSDLENVTR